MTARLFLDRLEQLGVLEPSVIADLRQQIAAAGRPISAETLAKLLVDNGHLTKFQAAKLVEEVTAAREEKREGRTQSTEVKKQMAQEQAKRQSEDEELAELLGDLAGPPKGTSRAATPKSDQPPTTPSVPKSPRPTAGQTTSSRGTEQPPRRAAGTPPSSQSTSGSREDSKIIGTRRAGGAAPPPEPWLVGGEETSLQGSVEPDVSLDDINETTGPTAGGSSNFGPAGPRPLPGGRAVPGGRTPIEEDLTAAAPSPLSGSWVDENQLATKDDLAAVMPQEPTAAAVRKKRLRTNPWESPLILVGGFALIVLTILSVVMIYSLTRGTAAEYFQQAENDYRNGAYANAIAKYDKFLRFFPNDPNVSLARVRRHMAQLRMEAEGARDPEQGLRAAQSILPEIEKEEAFHEARAELATLLTDIARAFAEKAKSAASPQQAVALLKKVDEAMTLVNNPVYIPTTLRKTQANVLERIEETVVQVRRDIERQERLAQALQDMDAAISAGQPRQAFRVRDALVADYPGLARHEAILQRIAAITEKERDLIRVTANQLAPQPGNTEDGATRVLFYSRSGSDSMSGSPQPLAIPIHGNVYGLDARNGRLLWRRFVGWDCTFTPVAIDSQPVQDWLLLDTEQWRLMRIQGDSGAIRWQVMFKEPVHHPVRWRDRVLVTTQSGKVYNLSLEDGQGSRVCNLDQTVDLGPAADDRFAVLYQVGEYDNLYVLSAETLDCREVFYLGHRRGEIAVPPTVAAGMLFVVFNSGLSFSMVHVLTLGPDGLGLKPVQDPIRLDGQVLVPPLVLGRRVVFVTNTGATVALEVNPQDSPPVTREIAPLPPTRSESMITYAVGEPGTVWFADQRLVAYDIQASQAQFARRWVSFEGHSFVSPLYRIQDALICVRKPPKSAGYRVAAVDAATGKNVSWQTDLGFPLLAVTAVQNGSQLIACSSSGAVFRFTPSQNTTEVEATSDLRIGDAVFDSALPLGGDRWLLFSRSGRFLIFDPARQESLHLVQLTMRDGDCQTDPIAMADHLIVPLRTGEIAAFGIVSGTATLLPFQPPIKPGTAVTWLPPIRLPEAADEFVIADDQQRLFRVGVVESGGRRLASLEQTTTEEQLVGRLAVVGNVVLGVSARADTDVLWAFSLPRFKAGTPQPLAGRVVWGPYTVGELALLAVVNQAGQQTLLAVDAQQQARWSRPLESGRPVGVSVIEQGDLLLATQAGALLHIRASDGQVLATVPLAEPAAGAPLKLGSTVWVPAPDGALLRVELPQTTSQ